MTRTPNVEIIAAANDLIGAAYAALHNRGEAGSKARADQDVIFAIKDLAMLVGMTIEEPE